MYSLKLTSIECNCKTPFHNVLSFLKIFCGSGGVHPELYGKVETEGPHIFAALGVPLDEGSNSARRQILFGFLFGKCRVLTSGALQRRGSRRALRELDSSGGKTRPDCSV
jgi:hypothetical protein